MTRLFVFGALVLATGCLDRGSSYTDVVGPFTGDVHTWAVASFEYPTTSAETQTAADDLDGDGDPDNELGQAIVNLGGVGDLTTDHSGGASVIEIQADDFTDDPSVGVTYLGAPGDPATVVGGGIVERAFAPNPSRETHVPGEATLRLPVFSGAARSVITLYGAEITIAADGSTADIRGGVDPVALKVAIVTGISQMLAAEPDTHSNIVNACDANKDRHVSDDELAACELVSIFVVPDIAMFDANHDYAPHQPIDNEEADSVSFALRVHLSQQ